MPADESMRDRKYNVVVWGASGFTGRLVVEYMAERYPPGETLRWAVGGRNRAKLDTVLGTIRFPADRPDIIVADSHNRESMHELASATRVILTTVGPYAKYGTELVKACVENGTHYCDLCGEVQWMRKIIDEQQEAAARTGARIVMSCGFDSIPSDLGVLYLHKQSLDLHGSPLTRMRLLVRGIRGGASGGTFASMLNAIGQARENRAIARILTDPYALNPDGEREGPDKRDQSGARFDKDAGVWTSPFVMAGVNTRVVRRSNALLGYPYGRRFRYSEATIVGPGIVGRARAVLQSWGLKLFVVAAAIPLTRKLIVQRLLPAPGEGPSKEQRESGFFNLLILGTRTNGSLMRLRVKGDRDPGYGSTSKMLAESAVCLATDELNVGGGCWTPASAMGSQLLKRLRANAGLSFELE